VVTEIQAATQGFGVYSVAEASRYARMPVATLQRWFFGDRVREPMRSSGIESGERKRITFIDFIEALAIRALRTDHNVPLQKIREAIRNARDEYQIQHPFAHKDHRTVLIGRDLHIFFKDDPEHPVGLTGRDFRQKSMRPCIEAYMRDLEYGPDGLARLYRAYRHAGHDVVMNPKLHFGEPFVETSGYTAETLWRAAVAEGSIERAAELYEVPVEAVESAYRYWNLELGMPT
jgi:uncharacterized protein (DUF433 family)